MKQNETLTFYQTADRKLLQHIVKCISKPLSPFGQPMVAGYYLLKQNMTLKCFCQSIVTNWVRLK